jgi:excisionase family DNA binding protein
MADWITTDEAAEISGYNIQHLRALIREQKIKADKKGGQYWVDRQSLSDYLQAMQATEDRRHGPKKHVR